MLKLFNKIVFSIKKNKTKTFSLIVLGFLLLLTPVQSVHADFWSDLANAIVNLATLPMKIGLILSISLILTPLIMNGIIAFLIYVITVLISRSMIVYSLDTPISPSSLNAGNIGVIVDSWNFTLDFVNMFFALTLTFIGLATILGLKDYEAKKLLPKLLLIAILVNFTPVIIGFIVDMGNLVTNFFVSKSNIRDGDVSIFLEDISEIFATTLGLDKIGAFYSNLLVLIMGSYINALSESITLIGGIIIGIVFLLYSSYIYICITGMFFLRTIMLWILTILSPIAFFSYIFPDNSPFQKLFPGILGWKEWWEEFLKWVVVGIPFGLFLYISTAIFKATGEIPDISSSLRPLGTEMFQGISIQLILDNVTELFTYTVSIMMLYLGYKISLKAAPEMARSMIESTDKIMKKAVMTVATMGVGAVAGAAAGSMGSMASGLGGFSTKAASGGLGTRILGRGAGGLSKVMRKGQTGFTQIAIKNKPKLPSETDKMNDQQLLDGAKGAMTDRTRAEYYSKVKDWSKVSKKDKDEMIPVLEGMTGKESLRNEYGDTFKKMSKADIYSEKIRMGLSKNPEETEEGIDDKVEEIKDNILKDEKLEKEIEAEIIVKYGEDASDDNKEQFMRDLAAKTLNFEELKPGDLKDQGKDNITSLSARLGSHKLSGNSLKSIRNNYGDATASKLFKGVGGIGSTNLETLYQENPKLAKHLLTDNYGKTWEWEAGQQLDEKYKFQEEDGKKKKGNANWEKIKAHMTTISPKKSQEVIEVDSEITELAERIKEQRIQRHDDNNYEFNSSFVDGLLKNAEITPESTEASSFMDKWDKVQAGKEFIEARKKLQKKVDSILKEASKEVKGFEGLSKRKKKIKKNSQFMEEIKKNKEIIEESIKKFNKIENLIKNQQKRLETEETPALKKALSDSVKSYKEKRINLQKTIMNLDKNLTDRKITS